MNRFTTQTNEKKVAKYNLITFAVIILPIWIAGLVYSLLQEPIDMGLVGIIGVAGAIICAVLATQVKTNNVFTLRFEGDVLHLEGRTKTAQYTVYDIPASDFVLKQSDSDKEQNMCSLKIKNTVFNLKYVENYSELKRYIEENYRH